MRSAAPIWPRGRFSSSIGALHDPTGQRVDLDLVTQLQEQEVRLESLRPRQPRSLGRAPKNPPEVGVGVGRVQFPQRPAEPGPDLLEMPDVRTDRAIGQPGRRPREHEPRERVGLEISQFLDTRRCPRLAQVPHYRKPQPTPPHVHPSNEMLDANDRCSRIPKSVQHAASASEVPRTRRPSSQSTHREPQPRKGTRGLFLTGAALLE